MRTAHKCRLYPTPEQKPALNRTFGCVRVVWNTILAERQKLYTTEGKSTSPAQASRNLTLLKQRPEFSFLNEVSAVALQQAIRHQDNALKAFFQGRSRYPRFKSFRQRQAAEFTRSGFSLREGVLSLARIDGPVPFVWSWQTETLTGLNPTSITISRDRAGRYFVSFVIEAADPEPLPATKKNIGVDLGLKDFAVLSNSKRIAHPKCLKVHEKRLARYQRQMARKKRGSCNREKARKKVARQHGKVSDARKDFLHKASTDLVQRFDVIAIEDLAVSKMIRDRRFARSISDSGWGEFRQMLEYKAARYGRRIHVVDRFYPSSKTCSSCGHLLASLALSTRHWTCPDCSTRHDRDINAAKNLIAAGLAVDACGGAVRPEGATPRRAPMKQEPSPVRVSAA
jgi:putative transposase